MKAEAKPKAKAKPNAKAKAGSRKPAEARASVSAEEAVERLRGLADRKTLEGMARYGIPSTRALGVSMGNMLKLARTIGQDHALARSLWATGIYEARMLASLVGEADKVTSAEMKAWAADFDSWAICDSVCFKLWDRSPFAWRLAPKWAVSKGEFLKRTGFVLMACLALHDRKAGDADFLPFLPFIEKGAADDRNFVKKGVSWALRAIGGRNSALRKPASDLARRLAASPDLSARWVGKDCLKQMK